MAKKKAKKNNSLSKQTAAAAVTTATSTSSDTPAKQDLPDLPVAVTAQSDVATDDVPIQEWNKPDNSQLALNSTNSDPTAYTYAFGDHDSHIDQTQETWSSLQRDPSDLDRAKTQNHSDNHGGAVDDRGHRDQLSVHRAAPRRYEDDNDDDEDQTRNERSPLIRSSSRDSGGYNDGEDRQRRNREQEPEEPTTWLQWALKNGLNPRMWNRQTFIKVGLLVTLLTLIILSFTVFRIQDHIKDILRYIDGHKRIGAVLFILSYTVACMLFLPGSLFTVGAGFLFKPFPLALLVVLLGDIFAAILAFIFGRYVFYDWVKSMMSKHPKFNALDQVIKDDGWKIVVMLRLTPIPFNLITYFFSITSIQLFTVVWATCIGVLPGSCIGIWIGSLLKGLSGIDNPELERKNLVILGMNIVLIVCCILTLSIFGKRSLRKAMKRLDQHQALTNLHEVEVVIEGAAAVIRELEDNASIPPSLRSTMIEQLAAEETDPDYYYRGEGVKAAQRRHLRGPSSGSGSQNTDVEAGYGEEGEGESSTPTSTLLANHNHDHQNKSVSKPVATLPSSGFTRGEKITFGVIAIVAVLDVCICLPLYYHFAKQDD
ncbi:hypothetical protein BGX27_007334 [Mortierella sp. AM989]|nr:hypothetical protein BGX27_007334 [Mortierella sp. AM989]